MDQAGWTGKYVWFAQMIGGFGRKEQRTAANAFRLTIDGKELAKFFLRLKFLQNYAVRVKKGHRHAGAHAEGVQIFMQALMINGRQPNSSYLA